MRVRRPAAHSHKLSSEHSEISPQHSEISSEHSEISSDHSEHSEISFFFSFFNIFIGLFHTFLITILRTGSGLELSPLRAACCQSLLLHWRTLTSSCDSPQQRRHSADVEIH